MSLLGVLWRTIRLIPRLRQRHVYYHGGDDSVSVSKSGIELVAERADEHDRELSDPLPEVEVKEVVFGEGVIFTDGETPGSWIIARENGYIDWEVL